MSIYQCHHCSSNNRNLPSDQVISGSGSCYQAGWGRFCFQSFLSIQSPPRMFVGFGCWCYPCFVLFVCKFKHFFLGVGCDATRIRVGLNNNTSLDPFNLVESILSHGTYLESPHHSCHSFLSNMNSTFNVIYTYIYKYIMSMYADRWIHGVQICIIYIYMYVLYPASMAGSMFQSLQHSWRSRPPSKEAICVFFLQIFIWRGGLGVTQYDPLKFPNMAIFCEWGARFWDVSTHFCGVVKDHR